MKRGVRIALGGALIAAGLLLALFFAMLVLVADCTAKCVADGERAPAYGLVGAGLGAILAGSLLLAHRPPWPGLLAAGVLAMLAGLVTRGPYGWATAGVGLVVAALGAWVTRRGK